MDTRMDGGRIEHGIYVFGAFRLDPVRRVLTEDDAPVPMAARLFDTLLYLVENHGRLVEREELAQAVWPGRTVEDGNLAKAVSSLRTVLRGSGQTEAFIVTAPGRGYRFAARVSFQPIPATQPIQVLGPNSTADVPPLVGPFPARRATDKAGPPADRRLLFGAAVLAVLCVVALLLVAGPRRGPAGNAAAFAPPPRSVAVLPFSHADAADEQFADGVSEELINALGRVGALRVAGRMSSFSFKGRQPGIGEIARQLNVATVLEGSVRRDGKSLRVTAQLVDAVTGYQIWAQEYDRDRVDLLSVEGQIAEAVIASQGRARGQRHGQADAGRHDRSARLRRLPGGHGQPGTQGRGHRRDGPGRLRRGDRDRPALRAGLCAAGQGAGLQGGHGADAGHGGAARGPGPGATRRGGRGGHGPRSRGGARGPGAGAEAGPVFVRACAGGIAARSGAVPGRCGDPDGLRVPGAGRGPRGCGPAGGRARRGARSADAEDLPGDVRDTGLRAAFRRGVRGVASRRDLAAGRPRRWAHLSGDRPAVAGRRRRGGADLRGRPRLPTTWPCLAWAQQRLGRQPEAEAALARLHTLLGDDGAYIYARIAAQWGRRDDALRWLRRAYDTRDAGLIAIRIDPFLATLRTTPEYRTIEQALGFPP